MAAEQGASRGFNGLQIGDLVRLRSGDGEGFKWTVIGRSFGSMTVDLMTDDTGAADKIRYRVKPAALERFDATGQTGLPNKSSASTG